LVWNVDDTFEIILRLPSEQSAWNVMTLNILIAQPELEKQGAIHISIVLKVIGGH
jgi:hypothetical protein